MKKAILLSFFFFTILFLSCSKDDENIKLFVKPQSEQVLSEQSVFQLTVNATSNWSIVEKSDWIHVDRMSGTREDSKVVVTVLENLSEDKRKGSITIQCGKQIEQVDINQLGQYVLQWPSQKMIISSDGGVVPIVSVTELEVEVPNEVEWISVSKKEGVVRLVVERTPTERDRLATLKVTDGEGADIELLVVQTDDIQNSEFLSLKRMKIDNISCVIDENSLEVFYPVDMDSELGLVHKIEFEGLGVDYIMIDDQKIKSGMEVKFDKFEPNSQFELIVGHPVLGEKRTPLILTGLPIVSISAPQGIIDEPKRPCHFMLIDPKGRTNDSQIVFEHYAGIEWRGSGALRYPKKAFGVELRNEENEEEFDAELLGLRSDGDWILDAMWLDHAKMRNRVCFDIWNEFNELYYKKEGLEKKAKSGTYGHLVELFLDGAYHGMYVLSDKLDRKQLKIKKKGGYLYKLGGWSEECILQGYTSFYDNNNRMWNDVKSDYPKEVGDIEFKYYMDLINFISNTSKEEFSMHFDERIDVDNMIDCFLYTNLIMGYDNLGRNTFWGIYNVALSTKMIPLIWDLDGTLGRSWDGKKENPEEGWLVNNRHNGQAYRIYERILKENPAGIHSKIKNRWHELRQNVLTSENMNSKLDYYMNQQINSGAEKREMDRWDTGYKDVRSEVLYIKDWYVKRLHQLDKLVNEF